MLTSPKHDVAVVIPVYKTELNAHERISYDRVLSVLDAYPIALVAPENLDLSGYVHQKPDLVVRTFSEYHFCSIDTYSNLLLQREFYEGFLDYEYILVYQLDAFVFSDVLQEWCARKYDYVGAPWLDLPIIDTIASEASWIRRCFPGLTRNWNRAVGNGGFSLRKVRSFWRALSLFGRRAREWRYYEDTFWAFYVPSYNPFFKVPGFDEALKFSFELNPAKCYSLNNQHLPFGCHAWDKYDIGFWRPIFRQFGYEI